MTDDAPMANIGTLTRAFFGEGTPLMRAPEAGGRPYERRPQQAEMAEAIADAFAAGDHLCVEAPTGVGKTFAYLIPALYLAHARELPVVISTHTISLQEQIIQKDLPVLQALLEVECRAALAKGRSNYLCLRRFHALAGGEQAYLPSAELLPEVEALRGWTETTADGSLSDLATDPSPSLWGAVCAEVGNCLNARCPCHQRCFLMQARRRLAGVHLVVVNHALFFADLAMKIAAGSSDGGVLPPYAAVVLDEGHMVEDTAASHLGLRLTNYGLRRALTRLYHPQRHRGLLTDVISTDARLAAIDAYGKSERFFRRILDWLEPQEANPLRYTRPGHVPDLLAVPLERLERELLIESRDSDDDRGKELQAIAGQIHEFRLGLHSFIEMTLPERVYWFERSGQEQQNLAICALPIEVAPVLRENLFNQDFTVVVTSATLAVGGRMDYFMGRIGAEEARTLVLDSPFDFEQQVTLHVPFDMPNPNDTDAFVPAACGHIRAFLLKTEGRAFVLFTSYRMMREMADELTEFFEKAGIRLIVQGEGLPRSQMLELFREDVHSVIFGTDSFWMGVDVPGEALSNVTIVKLPFPVPDHPLVAAREEMIVNRGGRAFWHYALPEAILKFRQGFGRLIRSRDDSGIVVVLDNRILRSGYGKLFLESLPPCRRCVF